MFAIRVIALLIVLLPSTAFAHTGVGATNDIAHGLLHPLTGIDHILAMIAMGIIAAHLGGKALWLVPASFVAAMALGGAAGVANIPIPFVETGIAVSVIALGLVMAFEVRLPLVAAMALTAFSAIFHGHAHGAELPDNASGLAYGTGFMIATASLHAVGIGIGFLIGGIAERGGKILSLSGCAMAVAGVAILLGIL